MPVEIKYEASAIASGGRDGIVRTSDGLFVAKLTVPAELGGPGGDGLNPEQMFASLYAACFTGALKVAGLQQNIALPGELTVKATVGIGPRAEGGFGLRVGLVVKMPGLDDRKARQLIEDAHQICPYSNATRGNVDVALDID